jgi:hypothetical protein
MSNPTLSHPAAVGSRSTHGSYEWCPRPGTIFLRKKWTAPPPDYIGKCEEWTGVVLGPSTNPWCKQLLLVLRNDTGEQIEIARNVWYNMCAQHLSGDVVEILWVPDV